jgi:phosphatidylserine synthase
VLVAQEAVTPTGKLEGVPIPVAPVVVCVTLVIAVLIQVVGLEEAAVTVLSGLTIIVPVADTVPHPPIKGML